MANNYQGPPPQDGYNNNNRNTPPKGPVPGYSNGASPPTYDQIFRVEHPKWNDWWAGILFLVNCAGFIAVSAIAINGYNSNKGADTGISGQANNFGLTTETVYLFGWVLIAAIVLSFLYLWLARLFTKQFIWITGILNIIFSVGTAIYTLYRHYWSAGILSAIFAVFTIIMFICWIPRIPFSALMLRTAIDISRKFGHVYLVSAIGGLLAAAFGAWLAVSLVAVYAKYAPTDGSTSWSKVGGLIAFLTFAAYWITEWLKNTIHTTISGVYGSWYFSSRSYPKKVTRGALRRALTYSFGSICLGSLIVALINFLRQICSIAQRQAAASGDMLVSIVFCVAGCLIGMLQWAVEWFNRYAFCHIALYGKPYFTAAKDTIRLMKDRGIDALANDCLVGPVFGMGATFVGFACGLLAYLYLVITNPPYNYSGSYTPVIIAYSFLIGLQVCSIFTTPLSSGVDTIFVAAAWDPEVMIRDHPDLYNQMVQVYPHVQQAIHA